MTKNRIYILIAILAIAGILVGIFYATTGQKKEEVKTENPKIVEIEKPKSTVVSLSGKTYNIPNSSLLTSFLVFPEGELKFDTKNNFTIKAEKLDLALLNNPEYQIRGKYPLASGVASGTITETSSPKIASLTVNNLTLDFSVDGQIADTAEKTKILESLAKIGIKVPVITNTTPLQLDVDISLEDKKLKIQNTTTAPIVVAINGIEK